ncbi:MAG: hypothetical protein H7Y15_10250, partial [Pseudonocardia sp.]|nr:hypothetical protein [Pseudonocardia sp.]
MVLVQDVPPQLRGTRQQLGATSTLTNFGVLADEVLTPVDGIRGAGGAPRRRRRGAPRPRRT